MWTDVRGDSSFEKKENNCWRLCWDGKETSLIQVPWRKVTVVRWHHGTVCWVDPLTWLYYVNPMHLQWSQLGLLTLSGLTYSTLFEYGYFFCLHQECSWNGYNLFQSNRIGSGRLWYQLPSGECKKSNLDLFSDYYFHQTMIAMLETISALGTKPVSSGRKNLGFQYYWAVGIRNGPWIYSRHIKTLSFEKAGRFSTTTTYRLESILAHLEPVMFHTPHVFSVRRSSLCLVYKNCRALCPKKKVLNQGVETPFTNS